MLVPNTVANLFNALKKIADYLYHRDILSTEYTYSQKFV
jgi:hypothetical protein